MNQVKTYHSGIDKWLIAIMALPLPVVLPLLEGDWAVVILMILIVAFVAHLFATTKYTVDNTTLIVKSGFFVNIKVDVLSIKEIAETNTWLSAPATSLDRLEITYNKYDSVIISPRNKAEFIADMLAINSQIKVPAKYSG
jgi:hypothetical protein